MACSIPEKDFEFWMPLDIVKAPSGEWRIGGIASDENAEDLQNERVLISGLDTSYLQKHGVWNWDHQHQGPGDVLGSIDIIQKDLNRGTLYVEGPLYQHVEKAKEVYNLMRSMKDTKDGRRLGLSIEGKVKERDKENNKVIKAAWIKACAITANPINQSTYVDFIKSLGSNLVYEPCDQDCSKCSLCECEDAEKPIEKASEGSVTIDPVVEHKEPEVKKAEVVEDSKPVKSLEEPLPSEPVQKADGAAPSGGGLAAGHDIPATSGGVSGSALRTESLEQDVKVTTYQKKKRKQKTNGSFTKSELSEWLQEERNYSPKMADLMAGLLFLTKAIDIRGYVRTRKGKLERVSPFTRELSHEMYRIKTMSDRALITRARKITHPEKALHFYHAAIAAGKSELAGYIRSQGHSLGLTDKDFTGATEPVRAGLKEASRAFRAAA